MGVTTLTNTTTTNGDDSSTDPLDTPFVILCCMLGALFLTLMLCFLFRSRERIFERARRGSRSGPNGLTLSFSSPPPTASQSLSHSNSPKKTTGTPIVFLLNPKFSRKDLKAQQQCDVQLAVQVASNQSIKPPPHPGSPQITHYSTCVESGLLATPPASPTASSSVSPSPSPTLPHSSSNSDPDPHNEQHNTPLLPTKFDNQNRKLPRASDELDDLCVSISPRSRQRNAFTNAQGPSQADDKRQPANSTTPIQAVSDNANQQTSGCTTQDNTHNTSTTTIRSQRRRSSARSSDLNGDPLPRLNTLAKTPPVRLRSPPLSTRSAGNLNEESGSPRHHHHHHHHRHNHHLDGADSDNPNSTRSMPQQMVSTPTSNLPGPKSVVCQTNLPISLGERPAWWSSTMGQRSGSLKITGRSNTNTSNLSLPSDSSTSNRPASFSMLHIRRSGEQPSVGSPLGHTSTLRASAGFSGSDKAKDLHLLLCHPPAVEAFRKFLVSCFSCENLLFWEAADEAIANPTIEIFNNIFNDFIDDTADGMVNISSAVKLELTDQIGIMNSTQSITEDLIDALEEAKEEIFELMNRDMLPKFLANEASLEWRRAFVQKSNKFSLGSRK